MDSLCVYSLIIWVFKSGDPFSAVVRERCGDGRKAWRKFLALKVEEGGHEQEKAGGF